MQIIFPSYGSDHRQPYTQADGETAQSPPTMSTSSTSSESDPVTTLLSASKRSRGIRDRRLIPHPRSSDLDTVSPPNAADGAVHSNALIPNFSGFEEQISGWTFADKIRFEYDLHDKIECDTWRQSKVSQEEYRSIQLFRAACTFLTYGLSKFIALDQRLITGLYLQEALLPDRGKNLGKHFIVRLYARLLCDSDAVSKNNS